MSEPIEGSSTAGESMRGSFGPQEPLLEHPNVQVATHEVQKAKLDKVKAKLDTAGLMGSLLGGCIVM
jgi:hypothetical protein